MPSQLLVNSVVVAVPALDSVVVEHGIKVGGKPALPTLVISSAVSPLYVVDVTPTTARICNPTPATEYSQFRFERGYSAEVDAETVEPCIYGGSSPSFLPKFYSRLSARREGTVAGNFGASTSVDISPNIGGSSYTIPAGDYLTSSSVQIQSGYVQNSSAGLRRVRVSLAGNTSGGGATTFAGREIVVPGNSTVNIPDLFNQYVFTRTNAESYSNVRMNLTLLDGVSASVSYSVYDVIMRVITSKPT